MNRNLSHGLIQSLHVAPNIKAIYFPTVKKKCHHKKKKFFFKKRKERNVLHSYQIGNKGGKVYMLWNKLPLPSFPEISRLEPWQTQAQMKCLDQDIWVAWLDKKVGSSFQVPSLAWDFFIWRDTGPTVGPHVWNRKAAFENTWQPLWMTQQLWGRRPGQWTSWSFNANTSNGLQRLLLKKKSLKLCTIYTFKLIFKHRYMFNSRLRCNSWRILKCIWLKYLFFQNLRTEYLAHLI